MDVHELAGKPVPPEMLTNIPRLVADYYVGQPDLDRPGQRVSFGTSGHRGTSLDNSFNEAHVAAMTQAVCERRKRRAIDGPLYVGMDTHALSEPAFMTALEVLAGNGVLPDRTRSLAAQLHAQALQGLGEPPESWCSWAERAVELNPEASGARALASGCGGDRR